MVAVKIIKTDIGWCLKIAEIYNLCVCVMILVPYFLKKTDGFNIGDTLSQKVGWVLKIRPWFDMRNITMNLHSKWEFLRKFSTVLSEENYNTQNGLICNCIHSHRWFELTSTFAMNFKERILSYLIVQQPDEPCTLWSLKSCYVSSTYELRWVYRCVLFCSVFATCTCFRRDLAAVYSERTSLQIRNSLHHELGDRNLDLSSRWRRLGLLLQIGPPLRILGGIQLPMVIQCYHVRVSRAEWLRRRSSDSR